MGKNLRTLLEKGDTEGLVAYKPFNGMDVSQRRHASPCIYADSQRTQPHSRMHATTPAAWNLTVLSCTLSSRLFGLFLCSCCTAQHAQQMLCCRYYFHLQQHLQLHSKHMLTICVLLLQVQIVSLGRKQGLMYVKGWSFSGMLPSFPACLCAARDCDYLLPPGCIPTNLKSKVSMLLHCLQQCSCTVCNYAHALAPALALALTRQSWYCKDLMVGRTRSTIGLKAR